MRSFSTLRNIRLGIKNLMLHKLRSFLTLLGVVFGVGSVIAMLSVGEGASKEAMDRIRKLGSTNVILMAKKPVEEEQPGTQRVRMSMYGLTYEDRRRIDATIPFVQTVVPAKIVRKEARLGEQTMELRVVGTTPDWFRLVERRVMAGRVLRAHDMSSGAGVCLLTEQGARKLLATHAAIGQTIRIGGGAFEVVGIVQSATSEASLRTPDQNIDAYIPLSLARARYGDISVREVAGSEEREMVELHMVLVRVVSIEAVPPTAAALRAMLQRFHKKRDYEVQVPLDLLKQAEATKRTFNIVLGSIAGISLLVGGIGIMNIMLASVTERTREIGIRRAIGAKRRQIVGQFLIETTVLSVLGGLVGVGIGLAIPWLVTRFAGMPTVVPAYGVVLALCISAGIGIVFGIYPALRAAKLDPIVALRHE